MQLEKLGIILEAGQPEFEQQAVLNPAAIEENGLLHLFYRAVAPGNYSSIGYCQIRDGKVVYRSHVPVLKRERAYEMHGVEDPRITKLDDQYHLVYVAYDGYQTATCYATCASLPKEGKNPHFQKHGIISPLISGDEIEALCLEDKDPKTCRINWLRELNHLDSQQLLWDKDGMLFPRRINGQVAFLHRLLPNIQMVTCDNLSQLRRKSLWQNNLRDLRRSTILEPKYWYEAAYVGGGCPPIETEKGWLLIYHGVEESTGVKIYRAGAALLDLNYPTVVLGRLPEPLFSPEEPWERFGDVNNVVFPTGAVIRGELLEIYYGAADKHIGRCRILLRSLLDQLIEAGP